jgi:hypothetical protein
MFNKRALVGVREEPGKKVLHGDAIVKRLLAARKGLLLGLPAPPGAETVSGYRGLARLLCDVT